MSNKLDYNHILQTLLEDVTNPRSNAKYLYFNENSYYSYTCSTHFINLQYCEGQSYYIVFWDGDEQRASITKAYESDTFDDDTREIFRLFDMYRTEEEHFMDSTVKNIDVPYEVMVQLREKCTELREIFNDIVPVE